MGNTFSEFWNATEEDGTSVDQPLADRTKRNSLASPIEIPRVSIKDVVKYVQSSGTKERSNSTVQKQDEIVKVIYEALAKNGYIVLSVDEEVPDEHLHHFEQRLKQLADVTNEFFSQTQEVKKRSSDSKNNNRGYISVKGFREYLKLKTTDQDHKFQVNRSNSSGEVYVPQSPLAERERIKRRSSRSSVSSTESSSSDFKEGAKSSESSPREAEHFDDKSSVKSDEGSGSTEATSAIRLSLDSNPETISESYIWPKYPPDFAQKYNEAYESFMELAWEIFVSLFKEVQQDKATDRSTQIQDLQQAVKEKSSICLIHYFSPTPDQQNEPCEEKPRLINMNKTRRIFPRLESAAQSKIVDSAHFTTGILTFHVCNQVPGLQIFDKAAKAWISIDHLQRPGKDIVVTLGQKAKMFINTNAFEPTAHRVALEIGKERTSTAFLFDVTN